MIAISLLFTLLFLTQYEQFSRAIDKFSTMPFVSIYEPSGLVYISDNEFLVVEDEPCRPFHRIKLDSKGALQEMGEVEALGLPILLNDLEGITYDGRYIYAITSHSQNKSGNAGVGRTSLVRYEYHNGALNEPLVVLDFKDIVVAQLKSAMPAFSMLDIWAQINVEALAWSPVTASLYVAFRSPIVTGKSLVLVIQNPDEIFSQQSAVNAELSMNWIDLDNNGVRAMDWSGELNAFFLVTSRQGVFSSGYELWKWSGIEAQVPIKITSPDRPLPPGTEGLSTFSTLDYRGMIVVVDDGNEELDLPGHYKLIELELTSKVFDMDQIPES